MSELALKFDGSAASRFLEPHKLVSEVQTLARLLSYAQDKTPAIPISPEKRAETLLRDFSSLGGLMQANTNTLLQHNLSLQEIDMLKTVLAAQLHVLENDIKQGTVLSSWDAVLDYLKASIADKDTECMKILFLDRKNVLIKDEIMSVGTVDHTPVYPREVVKRALELNASAIVISHNHPSGNTTPSDSDISMTQQIDDACRAVGIILHDHIIVGRGEPTSFRALNHL